MNKDEHRCGIGRAGGADRNPSEVCAGAPKLRIFVIEDQKHAEQVGVFSTLQDAWEELHRRSAIRWDAEPNIAPCRSWRTCGRDYEILEYDTSAEPWDLLRRFDGLEVSVKGIAWGPDAPQH